MKTLYPKVSTKSCASSRGKTRETSVIHLYSVYRVPRRCRKALGVPITLEFNMGEEYVRIVGGQMKWFDIYRTDNGEGKPLCIYVLLKKKMKFKRH